MNKGTYKIREKVWMYSGMSGWHFVNVNKKVSKEIKEKFGAHRRGFGSVPVIVTVEKTKWKTSIFPDKKRGVYVLPLKAKIRKKENISEGKILSYSIEITTP